MFESSASTIPCPRERGRRPVRWPSGGRPSPGCRYSHSGPPRSAGPRADAAKDYHVVAPRCPAGRRSAVARNTRPAEDGGGVLVSGCWGRRRRQEQSVSSMRRLPIRGDVQGGVIAIPRARAWAFKSMPRSMSHRRRRRSFSRRASAGRSWSRPSGPIRAGSSCSSAPRGRIA